VNFYQHIEDNMSSAAAPLKEQIDGLVEHVIGKNGYGISVRREVMEALRRAAERIEVNLIIRKPRNNE
jgi:hypothetical protein